MDWPAGSFTESYGPCAMLVREPTDELLAMIMCWPVVLANIYTSILTMRWTVNGCHCMCLTIAPHWRKRCNELTRMLVLEKYPILGCFR